MFFATDYLVANFLKDGLITYYGFNNNAEILCVGHSRSDLGIDRRRIEQALNVPVAKYAVAGMDVFDRWTMLQHYFSEHKQKVKTIVYDVDFFTFNGRTVGSGPNNMQYRQLYPFMDNVEVDKYVKDKSTWSEYWSRKCVRSLRFNDPKVFARAVINHFKSPEIPTTKLDFPKYKKETEKNWTKYDNLKINGDAVACFKRTIKFIRSKNIKVIMLFLPIIDIERDKIDMGYRNKVMEIVRGCSAEDPGIVFLGTNKQYESSHDFFYDPLHFNKYGQAAATDDLINALRLTM